MATMTIRNVPEEMMERLRALAKARNCSIEEVIKFAFEQELNRWDVEQRIAQLACPIDFDPTALIAAEREARG